MVKEPEGTSRTFPDGQDFGSARKAEGSLKKRISSANMRPNLRCRIDLSACTKSCSGTHTLTDGKASLEEAGGSTESEEEPNGMKSGLLQEEQTSFYSF
jgi:hypothetical protein